MDTQAIIASKPTNNINAIFDHSSFSGTQNPSTLGRHLARRLVQIGITDVFTVPGDFNLILLDGLIAEPELNLIGCCNELNAGYAADGYARSRGVSACVVTFTVGGLSVINAIAGAYSENLAVICIVGGPNSNDYGSNGIIHHTIGLADFSQEFRCFQTVTCHQAVVKDLEDAHLQIDEAIAVSLKESKPVYISISCNLPDIPHPSFPQEPAPFFLTPKLTNQEGLEIAVEATAKYLNKAVKPVIVSGPLLRVAKACNSLIELADACGYAMAVMPSAKGLIPENHPNFIGTYWGVVSTPFCTEVVESADAYLFAGAIFDELNTAAYSLHVKMQKAVIIQSQSVVIANGPRFGDIQMRDFLKALARRLEYNSTAFKNYSRMHVSEGLPSQCDPKENLKVSVLFKNIQNMLSSNTTVIAEAGDSWFNCQKLKLPQGCGYECQINYGSIGWSVGATLGYAQAAPNKRLISCIGDGSFQMTAQDVSTMLRCGQRNIIFLLNNGGYMTEEQFHFGPYNVIKNWNYAALVDAIHNGEGKCWTTKVHCEEELVEAIKTATEDKEECLCFIEVVLHMDDTSKELIQFACRLAARGCRQNP
ncbi:PREDICTED: pyruvate [Prunus dulcis]|uniref:pyruvate decarboxylase n=1 Tax=Prunus dulcis TaxID=3755 RepID=A0A5E4GI73_PRUDU|nr:pyruvate decarboxylase 1-like [Prunus dulcis]VVA39549.1 PREDICTED: pyruvate [Prunus dulcis]